MGDGLTVFTLGQLQLFSLLAKTPAIIARAPSFAAAFRSADWTTLQGIPGWWSRSASSQDVSVGPVGVSNTTSSFTTTSTTGFADNTGLWLLGCVLMC